MNPNRSFILCATDFSPHAREAVNVAIKIARLRNEKLRLVHATVTSRPSVAEIMRNRLDDEIARIRNAAVEIEPLVLEGNRPAQKVISHIQSERPSLVVVGGAVKSPLDRWALGSFSESVAEGSPVPTLVVRNPDVFDAWDWTKARLRVLLALDFSAASDAVLRWAKRFQAAGPCDFTACHVNWRAPSADELAVSVSVSNTSVVQKRLERDLHAKVRDQMGDDGIPVVVRAYFGDPGPCIIDIAREQRAHVIAVGAHQRHGLQRLAQFSVSREILHATNLNVVCVPVRANFDPRDAHIPDFHRVLIATDFSDLGNTAVPYGCAACCIGGLVKVVHVAPPARGRFGSVAPGWSTDLRNQLRALIPNETGARCQPPEVAVLVDRDVSKAICGEADRFGADLVCMASHGLGASRALHGSVTKAVLKASHRPVLVVRRPDE